MQAERTGPSSSPPLLEDSERGWPQQGEWTYEDYCRLPDDGWKYEVIGGVLRMTPAPSPEHQAIVRNLSFLLMEFLREVLVGEIFFAPIDVLLPGGSAAPIQPDLLFLSRDRLGLVKERAIEGAPDLIVEVLSPSNWLVDRRDKYELYATAGVREYWIVDPKLKAIEVFVQRAGSFELLGRFEEGQSPRSEVLEGFRFSIDQLFVR